MVFHSLVVTVYNGIKSKAVITGLILAIIVGGFTFTTSFIKANATLPAEEKKIQLQQIQINTLDSIFTKHLTHENVLEQKQKNTDDKIEDVKYEQREQRKLLEQILLLNQRINNNTR